MWQSQIETRCFIILSKLFNEVMRWMFVFSEFRLSLLHEVLYKDYKIIIYRRIWPPHKYQELSLCVAVCESDFPLLVVQLAADCSDSVCNIISFTIPKENSDEPLGVFVRDQLRRDVTHRSAADAGNHSGLFLGTAVLLT